MRQTFKQQLQSTIKKSTVQHETNSRMLTFVTVMKSVPKKTPDTPSIRNRFLQATNATNVNHTIQPVT